MSDPVSTNDATAEATEAVRVRLSAAGLPASDGEVAILAVAWPIHLAQVAALYAVTETRYAAPALQFDAVVDVPEWGGD